MAFQLKKLDDELDKLLEFLQSGLDDNAILNEKRKFANSILPMDKHKLMMRLLSKEEKLSENQRLDCLSMFLDEGTMHFDFLQYTNNQITILCIFQIILRYCPNIKSIDFINLRITAHNKENLKIFLKQCTSMESLRVLCLGDDLCAINHLLIQDNFELHDRNVQNALLKIEYIDGYFLDEKNCAKLLFLLPNLKTLGMFQIIGPAVSFYIENYHKRVLKLTIIYDLETSLSRLENLLLFCPKTERITLDKPEINVIENLWRFPLLIDIKLYHPNLIVNEVINLLKKIGNQLQILILFTFGDSSQLDPIILQKLCPKLDYLKINSTVYDTNSNK